jgi:hypothetical protein
MGQFIDEHHARFRYHPKFTTAYKSTAQSFDHPNQNRQVGPKTWAHQVWIPSYDWKVITQHFRLLDFLGRGLELYELVQDFCSSYDDIIQKYITYPPGHRDIEELAGSVDLMSVLAANMSTSSRELKYEFRGDEPMSKLRDCMATLCSALAKHITTQVSTELEKEERQKAGSQLRVVDRMLRGKYPDSSFKSGIGKVEHLF